MGDFVTGDTVVLKSGGPDMTVDHLDPKRGVHCKWFAGKTLQKADFQPDMLRYSTTIRGVNIILTSSEAGPPEQPAPIRPKG